jgi:hypothetical protein
VAGKVTGPGGGPPGNVPVGGADESHPAAAAERPASAAPAAFADKLKSAGAPTPATGTSAKDAARATSGTADLAAELKAGKISPQAAVDKVIDRVVDKQLGTNAPAAVREKLRAALETAVADDPLLADKIRGLS